MIRNLVGENPSSPKKAALSLDKAAGFGIMNMEGRCHTAAGPKAKRDYPLAVRCPPDG